MKDVIERVPPHNIEAEQAVLAAMLVDREAIARVMESLEPASFYRQAHGREMDAHGVTALEHFRTVGAARCASPHPLFDVAYYLAQAPELAWFVALTPLPPSINGQTSRPPYRMGCNPLNKSSLLFRALYRTCC